MPGMPDLAMVESRDTHEDASLDRYVKLTMRIEATRDLERPVTGGPSGGTSNVGAIT